MSLQKKVALLLIAVIFQIACTDCKPQSLKQNPFERYVGSRIKYTADYSKLPYYHMNNNNAQKETYINPNIYKNSNFPEIDFPSDTTHREPSLFNRGSVSTIHTPKNKQYDITLLENFKKEARQKRKSKNQTNKKLPIPIQLEKDQLSLVVSEMFPEVEYPLLTMDTITPKYWNTLPYNIDIDKKFAQQNNYMPWNQANEKQMNNYNAYVNPTNIKQKKGFVSSASLKENKKEKNKFINFASNKRNRIMSSSKRKTKSNNDLPNMNIFESSSGPLIRPKPKRMKITGSSDKLNHDRKMQIDSSKIRPESGKLLERLDPKTTNILNKTIPNIINDNDFTGYGKVNEPWNVDNVNDVDFLQLDKLSSLNLRDLADKVLKQIGPLPNDFGLPADFSIPTYIKLDNMTVYDALPENMLDLSLSSKYITPLDNPNKKINKTPLMSNRSNLTSLYFIIDKVLEQMGSQQNNSYIPDYTSGKITNLGTTSTEYIVPDNFVPGKTNEKIVMSPINNILPDPLETGYKTISDKRSGSTEPPQTSLISNNHTKTNSLPFCPVYTKDQCSIYDINELNLSNNTHTLMEILNGSSSDKASEKSRYSIKENVNFNQMEDDLKPLSFLKDVLVGIPNVIDNTTENYTLFNTQSNSTLSKVLKYTSLAMPENETLHITPYDTSSAVSYNSVVEDSLIYDKSLATLANATLGTITEYKTMPENDTFEIILKYNTHKLPDEPYEYDKASKAKTTNEESEELPPTSITSDLRDKSPEYHKLLNYSEDDISKDNLTHIPLLNFSTNDLSDIEDNETFTCTSKDDAYMADTEIIENKQINDNPIETTEYKIMNATTYRKIPHNNMLDNKSLEKLSDSEKLEKVIAYYDDMSDENPEMLVIILNIPKKGNFQNLRKYEPKPKITDSDKEMLGSGPLKNTPNYTLEDMPHNNGTLTDTENYEYSSFLDGKETKTIDTQDTSSKIFSSNDVDIFSVMRGSKKNGKITAKDKIIVHNNATFDKQPEMPAIIPDVPNSNDMEDSTINELQPEILNSDEKILDSLEIPQHHESSSSAAAEDMPHRYNALIDTADDSSLQGAKENKTLELQDTSINNYNNDIEILPVMKKNKKIGETINTDEILAYNDTISDTQPKTPGIISSSKNKENPLKHELRPNISDRDEEMLDRNTMKNNPDYNTSEDLPYTYNTLTDTANDSVLSDTKVNQTLDTQDTLPTNYDINILSVVEDNKKIGETIQNNDDDMAIYYDSMSDRQPEMPVIAQNIPDSDNIDCMPKYELWPEINDNEKEKFMSEQDMPDIMLVKETLKNISNYGALTEALSNDVLEGTSVSSNSKESEKITEYYTLTDKKYDNSLSDVNINKNYLDTLPYSNANNIDDLSTVTKNKEISEIVITKNGPFNNSPDIIAESEPNLIFTNTLLVPNISNAGIDDNSSDAVLDFPNPETMTDFVEPDIPEYMMTSEESNTAIEANSYSNALFDIESNVTDSNIVPDVLDTVRLNITDIDQLLDVLLELLIGDSQTNNISGTEEGASTFIDTSLPHRTDSRYT